MAKQTDDETVPEAAPEGPKTPPREPAEYVVLTPNADGTFSVLTRVVALTGKKAKAQVAADLSTSGRLEGDGVDLIAVPARSFVADRARVEPRQPVVKIG